MFRILEDFLKHSYRAFSYQDVIHEKQFLETKRKAPNSALNFI